MCVCVYIYIEAPVLMSLYTRPPRECVCMFMWVCVRMCVGVCLCVCVCTLTISLHCSERAVECVYTWQGVGWKRSRPPHHPTHQHHQPSTPRPQLPTNVYRSHWLRFWEFDCLSARAADDYTAAAAHCNNAGLAQ